MHRLLTGPLMVDKIQVPISGLPAQWDNLKIVHLTDLHHDGLRLSRWLLEAAIARCNALQPDLICLTGDYVTDDPTPIYDLAAALSRLQSRWGIYAVLGNHDIQQPGAKTMVSEALQAVGIRVLWNEVDYLADSDLAIVGLADFWSREFNPGPVMNHLQPTQPRIVLSHNPDTAEHLRQWRVDLQLSGHTHGGQIKLPLIGVVPTWAQKIRPQIPRQLRRWIPYMNSECAKVVRHWEWAQGLHAVGSNMLYVNRGLGTFPPGRFLCPPEITVITLQRAVPRSPLPPTPPAISFSLPATR